MLYTDKGFSFEAELTQSVIFASRGSKPEEFHHQILIVKVPENSDMLDGIKEAKSIKQENQDEYQTVFMTYQLDGLYQEIKGIDSTYLWFWIDRADYEARANVDKIKELDLRLKSMMEETTDAPIQLDSILNT